MPAYLFFIATFLINFLIIRKGISRGIEKISRLAMPTLVIAAVIIAVRVATLGTINPAYPEWNIFNGYGFVEPGLFSSEES
ncbi:MAG: hypothetical protein MZV70_11180 [Desulfobacterales bacterium]|nr:hypothetical protein [Desulfobacterales bacterium]